MKESNNLRQGKLSIMVRNAPETHHNSTGNRPHNYNAGITAKCMTDRQNKTSDLIQHSSLPTLKEI